MEGLPILTCPDCGGKSTLTSWLPPKGYDPRLREFKCDSYLSDHTFYKVLTQAQIEHMAGDKGEPAQLPGHSL